MTVMITDLHYFLLPVMLWPTCLLNFLSPELSHTLATQTFLNLRHPLNTILTGLTARAIIYNWDKIPNH